MSGNTLMDPIGRLIGLRYKSHPWHGIDIGDTAPEVVTAYIEMTTTDTVKYEIDKQSGFLKIDRPQKYSNVVPALYGFMPQTFSAENVAKFCMDKTGREDVKGDGDPVDICVLTEKEITHGDIIAKVRPIGGFRLLDGNEADDKIVAVLFNDAVYGDYKDIADVPELIIERLKHYFLTYKDLPGRQSNVEITDTFGIEDAHEVIRHSMTDYKHKFDSLNNMLSSV